MHYVAMERMCGTCRGADLLLLVIAVVLLPAGARSPRPRRLGEGGGVGSSVNCAAGVAIRQTAKQQQSSSSSSSCQQQGHDF